MATTTATVTVRLPRSRVELTKLCRQLGLVAWKREPLGKLKSKIRLAMSNM